VAHPPGFALYTLASFAISRLPWASPAVSINWLSALLAALALLLVGRAVARVTGQPWAGVIAACALGFATTFWAQAVTANIRMPTACAAALMVERLANYRAALLAAPEGAPTGAAMRRPLAWLAFALGLGVAHHGSLVFVAAVFALWAAWAWPGSLRQPRAWLAGAVPLLSWLYFPLRAGAFGAPARIATLDGFLEHILARGFRGDMFAFAHPAALPGRLALFGNILVFEFTWPGLALIALGAAAALWLARRHPRPLSPVLLGAAAVHAFVAITYSAPQTVEYLLPAHVLLAAGLGLGAGGLLRSRRAAGGRAGARPALLALAALPLAWQFAAAFPSYFTLAGRDATREEAEAILRQAPPGAAVLAAWHWATPLWYLQVVEGQRPDVEVRYIAPRGESLARNWAEAIAALAPARPVLVTSFYAAEYAALPYRFVPRGPAWEVRAGPLTAAPPELTGAQDFGAWRFLGFHVQSAAPEGLTLLAAWQTNEAPRDISFFVHLLGPDGSLHSQMDVPHPAAGYTSGEALLDRYTLPFHPEAPPGVYTLVAGAYAPSGERLAEVRLGAVPGPQAPLGVAGAPAGAVNFGGQIWLAESRLSPGGPLRPGDELRVELRFIAARPISHDYSIGLAVTGPGYQWQAQADGTPAGGAIPTLKWIAGSRVTDTRTLTIPPEAAPGAATVTLALYDAFTQQNLALLDPALAAQGPALALGTVEVAAP
jgi:hypothetical protein